MADLCPCSAILVGNSGERPGRTLNFRVYGVRRQSRGRIVFFPKSLPPVPGRALLQFQIRPMSELTQLKVCYLAGTLGQGGAERQLFYALRALGHNRATA